MARGDAPAAAGRSVAGGLPDDAVLVARVRAAGDRHAFEALVRRHQSELRGLLRRLCDGDAARADDLAQETFLLAFRKISQFRGDAQFSTWLYRVAYNCFLMHRRGQRDMVTLELEPDHSAADGADAGAAPLTKAAADDDPAVMTDQAHLSADVARAMTVLSAAEKAAILQCYYLDRSHEEAALVLDCPVGTLKSHVFRAKAKLRSALAAWAPKELA